MMLSRAVTCGLFALLFAGVSSVFAVRAASDPTANSVIDRVRSAHGIPLSVRSKSSCEDPTSSQMPVPLSEKSLSEIAGQTIIIGFEGDRRRSPGVAAVSRQIKNQVISGVLILERNVSGAPELKSIIERLNTGSDLRPFIMIDQEGGEVERLRKVDSVSKVPSAISVARLYSVAEAERLYEQLAYDLARLGINVNLGPVVDLNLNTSNPIIGELGRSYGARSATVTAYGSSFVRGHRRAGVITAVKHFPGHGSSSVDSHLGMPDVTSSWSPSELEPFEDLIRLDRADMMMVGHVSLSRKELDTNGRPASLSGAAIKSVLRDQLCYDGVVVADDLAMAAITSKYSIVEAAVEAMRAGNDLLIVSKSENMAELGPRLNDALVAEAQRDEAFMQRLLEAYSRVYRLKNERLVQMTGNDSSENRSKALTGSQR